MPPAAGDVLTWERSFSVEDVRAFAGLVGDRGRHHLEPDARGRVMVHGLLTASIPTKIGGDLDFLAREMRFEFLRPVWTGERIACRVTIDEAVPRPGRLDLVMSIVCVNQDGQEVLRGDGRGTILIKGA